MTIPETIPLTAVPKALADYAGRPGPNYRKVWQGVVDGILPAEQVNGRYRVREDDIPKIASLLGVKIINKVAA